MLIDCSQNCQSANKSGGNGRKKKKMEPFKIIKTSKNFGNLRKLSKTETNKSSPKQCL